MADSAINKVLKRGVVNTYPSFEELEKVLQKDPSSLTFYWGIDPTAPFVHLGHTIPARKLEQLRSLGCKVVLLIGNFTATVGDPTDKTAARQALSFDEVQQNAKDYIDQLKKVIDIDNSQNPVEVKYNNDWLGEMKLNQFMEIAQNITVQGLLERDMFQKRIEEGKPIYVHEFLYPVLQGYDSVAMNIDGEVGGNDQTFNMLLGRELSGKLLDKEKFVITTKLLTDPTGKKMGKSEGNIVPINTDANNMYGSVMSWPDDIITDAFELLTDLEVEEIKSLHKELSPMEFKARLALEITKTFKGSDEATKAQDEFSRVFREKKTPTQIEEVELKEGEYTPVEVLTQTGLSDSNSEAYRLIEQGGFKVNDEVIDDSDKKVQIKKGDVIQRGKREFRKIK